MSTRCKKCDYRLVCVTNEHNESSPCYSEFGRGLIIALIKFNQHVSQFHYHLEMAKRSDLPNMNTLALWADGAKDHLQEIVIPEGEKWSLIGKLVNELQDKAFDMKKHFLIDGGNKKKIEPSEVFVLFRLSEKIALEIDIVLGIKNASIGEW